MVAIEKTKCISCLACISACPHGSINVEGLSITINTTKKCPTCKEKTCKILCPTGAISL